MRGIRSLNNQDPYAKKKKNPSLGGLGTRSSSNAQRGLSDFYNIVWDEFFWHSAAWKAKENVTIFNRCLMTYRNG